METILHHQEILLVTCSSFARRDFCEKESLESRPNESNIEKMVRACWNGLLDDLLPELVANRNSQGLYLVDVNKLQQSLLIRMSTTPTTIENEFSIDPGSIDLRGICN